MNPDVDRLVSLLGDASNAQRAAAFPKEAAVVQHPGLYSWWVDDVGEVMLSVPFGESLGKLIYAGQAGATSKKSGKEGSATLLSRIQRNHLGGNVGSSTFRQTLTAVLFEPLGLELAAPKKLTAASNGLVSDWMRDHLSLVVAACPDRATLAALEEDVLEGLDPPLNLKGMQSTDVRRTLRELRKRLGEIDLAS